MRAKTEERNLTEETKAEATDRIGRELRAEKKLNERRDVVMNYFFELTGKQMSEKQFNKYNDLFNKAEAGYNIKSFIRDERIIIDERVINQPMDQFISEQLGEIEQTATQSETKSEKEKQKE